MLSNADEMPSSLLSYRRVGTAAPLVGVIVTGWITLSLVPDRSLGGQKSEAPCPDSLRLALSCGSSGRILKAVDDSIGCEIEASRQKFSHIHAEEGA